MNEYVVSQIGDVYFVHRRHDGVRHFVSAHRSPRDAYDAATRLNRAGRAT